MWLLTANDKTSIIRKESWKKAVEFGKSFINTKSKNGSRDDLCATPYVIGSTFDL